MKLYKIKKRENIYYNFILLIVVVILQGAQLPAGIMISRVEANKKSVLINRDAFAYLNR